MNKIHQAPNSTTDDEARNADSKKQDNLGKLHNDADRSKGDIHQSTAATAPRDTQSTQNGANKSQYAGSQQAPGSENKQADKSAQSSDTRHQQSAGTAKQSGSQIEEDFAAASAKCNILAGDAKEKCLKEARQRFGQL